MSKSFRIHPSIGVARIGPSAEYVIAPEKNSGIPSEEDGFSGGIPISPDTNRVISQADLRDDEGKLKRQAARFRIYAYEDSAVEKYPNGAGDEVVIGSVINGKTVKDIVWTAHLANKKSNAYQCMAMLGKEAYANGCLPQFRNPALGSSPDDLVRRKVLIIDPGPRAISAAAQNTAVFSADPEDIPSFCNDQGRVQALDDYSKSFPNSMFSNLFEPSGPLDNLGNIETDKDGRLLVVGGFGRAVGIRGSFADYYAFTGDTNNDGWFDDSADGPVNARIVLDDDSVLEVHGGWVISVNPAYAPQIRNTVSTWDDVYDTFIRQLGLQPDLYSNEFQDNYKVSFADDVYPIFRAAEQVRWVANIPQMAEHAHIAVGNISPNDDPDTTILAGLTFIRNPNNPDEAEAGVPLMPLSLGDSGQSFLSVTKTQYFMLSQWSKGAYSATKLALGDGELLDKVSLSACIGGRYAPGIEFSYIVRDADIFEQNWSKKGCGPFRVKQLSLDYQQASPMQPFLNAGWIPYHSGNIGLEPGDMTKFLAIPWQTDYNSCSVHQTAFNHPVGSVAPSSDRFALFWSWPAQRPIAVYPESQFIKGNLGQRVYSIRGAGTEFKNNSAMSSFQNPMDSLVGWDKIGIIMQASDEDGKPLEIFLESQSQLAQQDVITWPFKGDLSL